MDIENPQDLVTYLRDAGHIGRSETPVTRVLAGGVSNRTVLVQRDNGEAWVLKQALEKLRVKTDWFSDPARIHREAAALRHLPRLAPEGSITPLVFEDMERHVLAMQAVPQPHDNLKEVFLRPEEVSESLKGRRARGVNELLHAAGTLGEMLGEIHLKAKAEEAELSRVFGDRSFFESLRIEPYYQCTAEVIPEASQFLLKLIEATRKRAITLVHGDFSPKNVLVYSGAELGGKVRLVLLDHEVIHWGDPAFDIGFMCAHLLSKANHLSGREDHFITAARFFWLSYRKVVGNEWAREVEPFAIQHTLACLLARVDGMSPLEYLRPEERQRQRASVLKLMADDLFAKRKEMNAQKIVQDRDLIELMFQMFVNGLKRV